MQPDKIQNLSPMILPSMILHMPPRRGLRFLAIGSTKIPILNQS